MTWRAPHENGPEPLPPTELLRIRDELVSPPRPDVRHRHLSATAAEARIARGTAAHAAQVLARRGARVIAGVAGIIVVTSGLAGAQILPEPARALTAAVTERLVPGDPEPTPAEPAAGDHDPEDEAPASTVAPAAAAIAAAEDVTAPTSERPAPLAAVDAAPAPSVTTTTVVETTTSTTSSTSSTTVPETTTTSTTAPGSTTTTTVPETTTTTAPVEKKAPPPAPAFGRTDPDDPGGAG